MLHLLLRFIRDLVNALGDQTLCMGMSKDNLLKSLDTICVEAVKQDKELRRLQNKVKSLEATTLSMRSRYEG